VSFIFIYIANSLQTMTPLSSSQLILQGSIPAEIGQLSNLKYLRLSHNAFTGAAPEALGGLKRLQLLQLQSNRITGMPHIPRLNDSIHRESTFITDCGVPSYFEWALECENCTMCCKYYLVLLLWLISIYSLRGTSLTKITSTSHQTR
jgi:hypothetical protein